MPVDFNHPLSASMDFADALRALKRGERVAREGWNGKGMWIVIIHAGNAVYRRNGDAYDMQDCIGMRTAGGVMQPGWLASQADLLAEDWRIV